MPEKQTVEKPKKARREGKAPSTQAGEFVREEIHHVREGKHGARSSKQAVAIGLSKARRAGVNLPPPAKGTVSEKTRRSAERARKSGQRGKTKTSSRRSKATKRALKRESRSAAATKELAKQARSAARRRRPSDRRRPNEQRAPKGRGGRSVAAREAARTRARR
jgi:hypothetical protein